MEKLLKPENEIYNLESALDSVEASLHTYNLNGKRNILSGASDYDLTFERFERFMNGELDKTEWILNYAMFDNCDSIDDAKKEWQNRCKRVVGNVKLLINKIEAHRDDFPNYPDWLKNRCSFATDKLLNYLIKYLKEDTDLSEIDFISIQPESRKIH